MESNDKMIVMTIGEIISSLNIEDEIIKYQGKYGEPIPKKVTNYYKDKIYKLALFGGSFRTFLRSEHCLSIQFFAWIFGAIQIDGSNYQDLPENIRNELNKNKIYLEVKR